MKSSFARNLQIGSGLSLLLLLISSIASYLSISRLLDSSKWVNHTYEVISKIDGLNVVIKDAETAQRGYLLTGSEKYLGPYMNSYKTATAGVEEITKLTSDNPVQRVHSAELKKLVDGRYARLQFNVNKKRTGQNITTDDLELGNNYSIGLTSLLKSIVAEERRLLVIRTSDLKRFSGSTPVLIILASILSLAISIFFLSRVMRDFKIRAALQKGLEDKDAEITKRIEIIQGIAGKIATGDYSIRVTGEERDGLGALSISLNKMAESLDYSFALLSDKEWLQSGIAKMNETVVGEKNIEQLTRDVLETAAINTESQVGTFYVNETEDFLRFVSGYAYAETGDRTHLKFGQGLAGEAALSKRQILIADIPQQNLSLKLGPGAVRPQHVIAFPILQNGRVKGVIELASIKPFTQLQQDYFSAISHTIGIAIHTTQNRARVQELLEETQAQSEELQTQHSELENLNTELEGQSQKLQASEEELRVQQEELMQANQELEERSRLLEEKNQVIVERNLDIQHKADELEVSTKYKSEFLANMSHELRTPLNSILLLSRMMSENSDENLNDEQVEAATVIQNSGKSLLSLIDEILDLSKIEAGKMELDYAEVEVEDVCRDMKSLFSPIAREKNLELHFTTDQGLPVTINTDKFRLEQILKNLISNALKFTAKGSVSLKISAAKTPGFIDFSVSDTGLGIPKEKQGLIFEAFQQADGSTKRKYGGTGLGLSISRELSKLLGGEISLSSTPGSGSTFTITVPVEKIAAQERDPEQAAEQEEEQSSPAPEENTKRFIADSIPSDVPDDRDNLEPNDKIVLIIEDDTVFAKALLDFTHRQGYKGVVAVRGDLGIEMAQSLKPVAVLLDIQLPVKDGWQVMEELKGNPKTRHIPVHIMSSMEVKRESLSKGAVDFINKPVAIEQMQGIFQKLDDALNRGPKKVLIVEENPKHAQALSYFLQTFNINSEIRGSVKEGINALKEKAVDCVILDMGIPDQSAYETLETVKDNPGMENLPIIIFTGKNLSKAEENKIRQYADSIVVKTAHSYQRILDEVALFLHLIEENIQPGKKSRAKNAGGLNDVLKDKKILIADDDVRNIYSLTKSLEQHKIKVISATDGKEALRQLEENPDVDLVLMDMMMPEMDGYESTKQIRQHPKFRNLPVLAVTAKAMVGDREKCIKAGASDYISKPVDIDQLISLLRVWLYDRPL